MVINSNITDRLRIGPVVRLHVHPPATRRPEEEPAARRPTQHPPARPAVAVVPPPGSRQPLGTSLLASRDCSSVPAGRTFIPDGPGPRRTTRQNLVPDARELSVPKDGSPSSPEPWRTRGVCSTGSRDWLPRRAPPASRRDRDEKGCIRPVQGRSS